VSRNLLPGVAKPTSRLRLSAIERALQVIVNAHPRISASDAEHKADSFPTHRVSSLLPPRVSPVCQRIGRVAPVVFVPEDYKDISNRGGNELVCVSGNNVSLMRFLPGEIDDRHRGSRLGIEAARAHFGWQWWRWWRRRWMFSVQQAARRDGELPVQCCTSPQF